MTTPKIHNFENRLGTLDTSTKHSMSRITVSSRYLNKVAVSNFDKKMSVPPPVIKTTTRNTPAARKAQFGRKEGKALNNDLMMVEMNGSMTDRHSVADKPHNEYQIRDDFIPAKSARGGRPPVNKSMRSQMEIRLKTSRILRQENRERIIMHSPFFPRKEDAPRLGARIRSECNLKAPLKILTS